MYQMLSAARGDDNGGADLQIVLVGKTGAGKSATGNTILNAAEFPSKVSSSTVTKQCCRRSATVGDQTVAVTDTPDLLSAHRENNDLQTEIEKCVSLSSPGVHAFLFILTLNTFTQQEQDLVSRFKQIFGEDVLRFTVVVFTHGDQLQGRSVDELISGNSELSNLINQCGRRYNVLNNANPSNRQQVHELLQKIHSMVSANANKCYSLEMLREVERRLEEQREKKENKREMKSWKALVLKCVMVVMILCPIPGCVLIRIKGSANIWGFLGGCVVGVSPAALGAFTGKIWVLMLKSPFRICRFLPQGCPKAQFLKKLVGVFFGGVFGSAVGHMFTGQVAVSLLAGLAGATGAFITTHSFNFSH